MTTSIKRWREDVPAAASAEQQLAAADREIDLLRARLLNLEQAAHEGSPAERSGPVDFTPKPICVTGVTEPWKDSKVRPELLGNWKVIPLAMGDGTVITTADMRQSIASFSDYNTAQVLAALHNESLSALKQAPL
jgi:hypothetical protein